MSKVPSIAFNSFSKLSVKMRRTKLSENILYHIIFSLTYTGCFFYKKLKYVKPRLGVSMLMQIVLDTPNLA